MTDETLHAGDFRTWLDSIRDTIPDIAEAEVPCGECTACCQSSQFVEITKDETDTLAHIPPALLFPAPGRPDSVVLGFDQHGRCPMLRDGGCSIYDHRPRICRAYDCRIFAGAGVTPQVPRQDKLARRVARWRFTYASEQDRVEHEAIRDRARTAPAGRPVETALRALLTRTIG